MDQDLWPRLKKAIDDYKVEDEFRTDRLGKPQDKVPNLTKPPNPNQPGIDWVNGEMDRLWEWYPPDFSEGTPTVTGDGVVEAKGTYGGQYVLKSEVCDAIHSFVKAQRNQAEFESPEESGSESGIVSTTQSDDNWAERQRNGSVFDTDTDWSSSWSSDDEDGPQVFYMDEEDEELKQESSQFAPKDGEDINPETGTVDSPEKVVRTGDEEDHPFQWNVQSDETNEELEQKRQELEEKNRQYEESVKSPEQKAEEEANEQQEDANEEADQQQVDAENIANDMYSDAEIGAAVAREQFTNMLSGLRGRGSTGLMDRENTGLMEREEREMIGPGEVARIGPADRERIGSGEMERIGPGEETDDERESIGEGQFKKPFGTNGNLIAYVGQTYGDHIDRFCKDAERLAQVILSGNPMTLQSQMFNSAVGTLQHLGDDAANLESKYNIKPGTPHEVVAQTTKGKLMEYERQERLARLGDASANIGMILQGATGRPDYDITQLDAPTLLKIQNGLEAESTRLDNMVRSGVGPDGQPLSAADRKHCMEMARTYREFNKELKGPQQRIKAENRAQRAQMASHARATRNMASQARSQYTAQQMQQENQRIQDLRTDDTPIDSSGFRRATFGQVYSWMENNAGALFPESMRNRFTADNGYLGFSEKDTQNMRNIISQRLADTEAEYNSLFPLVRQSIGATPAQRARFTELDDERRLLREWDIDLKYREAQLTQARYKDSLGYRMHTLGFPNAKMTNVNGTNVPADAKARRALMQDILSSGSLYDLTDPSYTESNTLFKACLEANNQQMYGTTVPTSSQYVAQAFFNSSGRTVPVRDRHLTDAQGRVLRPDVAERMSPWLHTIQDYWVNNNALPSGIQVPEDIVWSHDGDMEEATKDFMSRINDEVQHYDAMVEAHKTRFDFDATDPTRLGTDLIKAEIGAEYPANAQDWANLEPKVRAKIAFRARNIVDLYSKNATADQIAGAAKLPDSAQERDFRIAQSLVAIADMNDTITDMDRQFTRVSTNDANRIARAMNLPDAASAKQAMSDDMAFLKRRFNEILDNNGGIMTTRDPTYNRKVDDFNNLASLMAIRYGRGQPAYGTRPTPYSDTRNAKGMSPKDEARHYYDSNADNRFKYTFTNPEEDIYRMFLWQGEGKDPDAIIAKLVDDYKNDRSTTGRNHKDAMKKLVTDWAKTHRMNPYERRMMAHVLNRGRHAKEFKWEASEV